MEGFHERQRKEALSPTLSFFVIISLEGSGLWIRDSISNTEKTTFPAIILNGLRPDRLQISVSPSQIRLYLRKSRRNLPASNTWVTPEVAAPLQRVCT